MKWTILILLSASLMAQTIRPSGVYVGNTGTFTNTQMHEYMQSILNNCSPSTEWHATQGTYATDALSGCAASPVTATGQANGIAGYASGNPGASIVGGFFQGRCLANGCNGWGSNSVAQDVAGLTANVSLYGSDVNLNPQNASTAYTTLSGYNAALAAPTAGNFGNGYLCQIFGANLGRWSTCFDSADQATDVAFVAGSHTGAAPQTSQNFYLYHRDGGGVLRQSSFYTTNTGQFAINSYLGDIYVAQQGTGKAFLYFNANTGTRGYTFPDATGTVALIGAVTSGIQHGRFSGVLGGTCPTAAAIGAACTSGNLNWATAYADNNYTVTCSLMGSMTGQPHIVSLTQQAAGAGITITIAADTAAAANVAAAGFVDCIAIHD